MFQVAKSPTFLLSFFEFMKSGNYYCTWHSISTVTDRSVYQNSYDFEQGWPNFLTVWPHHFSDPVLTAGGRVQWGKNAQNVLLALQHLFLMCPRPLASAKLSQYKLTLPGWIQCREVSATTCTDLPDSQVSANMPYRTFATVFGWCKGLTPAQRLVWIVPYVLGKGKKKIKISWLKISFGDQNPTAADNLHNNPRYANQLFTINKHVSTFL